MTNPDAYQQTVEKAEAWAGGDWLKKVVAKGLMGLVVLHLEGTPSFEVITRTAGVWYHVMKEWPIAWDEALDRPRLRKAFTQLASQTKRWPAPSDLRALLPARVYPQPALPAVEYPPEKAAANLRKIKQMVREAMQTSRQGVAPTIDRGE